MTSPRFFEIQRAGLMNHKLQADWPCNPSHLTAASPLPWIPKDGKNFPGCFWKWTQELETAAYAAFIIPSNVMRRLCAGIKWSHSLSGIFCWEFNLFQCYIKFQSFPEKSAFNSSFHQSIENIPLGNLSEKPYELLTLLDFVEVLRTLLIYRFNWGSFISFPQAPFM